MWSPFNLGRSQPSHSMQGEDMSNTLLESAPNLEVRATKAIDNAPHLLGQTLHCEAEGGQVTLRGVVSSYFQKQMAQETLRRIDGVEEVTNLLEVSWSRVQETAPLA